MINFNNPKYQKATKDSIEQLITDFNHAKSSKALEAHNFVNAVLKLVHNILMSELDNLNEDNLFNRDNYRVVADSSYIELGEYVYYAGEYSPGPYNKVSQYRMNEDGLTIYLRYQESTKLKHFSESNLNMIKKTLAAHNVNFTIKGDTLSINYQYCPFKKIQIDQTLDDLFSSYKVKIEELRQTKIEKDEVLDIESVSEKILTILNTLTIFESNEMAAIDPREYKFPIDRRLGQRKKQELPFNSIINQFFQNYDYNVEYVFQNVNSLSNYGIILSINVNPLRLTKIEKALIDKLNTILRKDSIEVEILNKGVISKEIRIKYIYDKTKKGSKLCENFGKYLDRFVLKNSLSLANYNKEKDKFHKDAITIVKNQLGKFIKAVENDEIDKFKSPNGEDGLYVAYIDGPRLEGLGEYSIEAKDRYSSRSYCVFDCINKTLRVYLYYSPAATIKISKIIDVFLKYDLEKYGISLEFNPYKETLNPNQEISGGWVSINFGNQITKELSEPEEKTKDGLGLSLKEPKG